jgi:hypothetical protein
MFNILLSGLEPQITRSVVECSITVLLVLANIYLSYFTQKCLAYIIRGLNYLKFIQPFSFNLNLI